MFKPLIIFLVLLVTQLSLADVQEQPLSGDHCTIFGANCGECLNTQGCEFCRSSNSCVLAEAGTQCLAHCLQRQPAKCHNSTCSTAKSCGECDPSHCSWCEATNACVDTCSPEAQTCNGCSRNTSQCPQALCSEKKDCLTCTKMAECGWCSDTKQCLAANTTSHEPCGETKCKYFSVGNCEQQCASHADCSSCAKDTLCSWCAGDSSPDGLLRHSFCELAKKKSNCTAHFGSNIGPCPQCHALQNCTACAHQQFCGWCVKEGRGHCEEGDNSGSFETQDCLGGSWFTGDTCINYAPLTAAPPQVPPPPPVEPPVLPPPMEPPLAPPVNPPVNPPVQAPRAPPVNPPARPPANPPVNPPVVAPVAMAPVLAPQELVPPPKEQQLPPQDDIIPPDGSNHLGPQEGQSMPKWELIDSLIGLGVGAGIVLIGGLVWWRCYVRTKYRYRAIG